MRKFTVFIWIFTLVLCGSGVANAIPVNFDVAGAPLSSVSSSETTLLGQSTMTTSLVAGLDDVSFSLNEGESKSFDFIEFTMSGTGAGEFQIETVLAFDDPIGLSAGFQGGGFYGTFMGLISGNILYWEDNTMDVTLSDGNSISIALQQGLTIACGTSIDLKATVTNHGGGVAPVPEPATMLLMGTGLAGMAAFGRRRKAKKI